MLLSLIVEGLALPVRFSWAQLPEVNADSSVPAPPVTIDFSVAGPEGPAVGTSANPASIPADQAAPETVASETPASRHLRSPIGSN